VAAGALVFVLDLRAAAAAGAAYVGVVLLARRADDRRVLIWATLACALLTVAGYALSPSAEHTWEGRIDRGWALSAIGLAAWACERSLAVRSSGMFDSRLDAAPVAMVMVDLHGRITYANTEAEKLFGYTREELLGRPIEILIPERLREHHVALRDGYLPQPVARQMGVGRDLAALRRDGREFPVEIGLNPVETERGLHVLSAIVDLTERKRMERSLEASNEALSKSNSELEQFVYVASHDLKQPLRGIDNLAKWIVEDAADVLPAESRRHLMTLQQRVRRMEKLLADLLHYSRVGREESAVETVDTEKLVEETIGLLDVPPGFSIEVEAPLPRLAVHRTPLTQVFHNLIGNAIKHRSGDQGRIRIEARDAGSRVEFAVTDDGPGIPPEHHERVFRMFATLKPRDEVEGSGMGLAIVKKVVEARGGRISLESAPGVGSTFRFTWPRDERGADDSEA